MLNEQTQQTANPSGGQFADLLEEYISRRLRRGEVVTGTIVYLEEDVAYIDVGAKRDAVVPAGDLGSLDADMLESLKEGDQVKVYVTNIPRRGGDLVVSIERGLEATDWERAEQLLTNEEAYEYPVVGWNKGGALVKFGRLTGFVPNSQIMDVRRRPRQEREEVKDTLIGDPLLLKVIDVDQPRRRLVLSEMAARDEVREKRMEELTVGEVLEGRVVSLVPFGAFVDIGGVDGLIHISNLAWKQVDKPEDVLREGETLEVLVTGVDIDRERISLSRKALLPNPWETFNREHKPGDLIEGVVESVADFGAFVRLQEAIVGLIHISEMGDYGQRQVEDVFKPGDDVLVRITDIDIERERVGLSTKKVTREEAFDWMIEEVDEAAEEQPETGEQPEAEQPTAEAASVQAVEAETESGPEAEAGTPDPDAEEPLAS